MWHQTVSLLRKEVPDASLEQLCGLFGYSRQSYYKRGDNDFAESAIESLIAEKAASYRVNNPGIGCAKLYLIVKRLFDGTGCMPGRDAFINILRRHNLMVRIRRRKRYKTTDSEHSYRKYPNLIVGMIPSCPNQIWASDITYVETEEGVCYLSLITDVYSHKIVGWAVGPTLETTYPLKALEMALSSLTGGQSTSLIHHSDRGCQYCSGPYVQTLREHGVQISMTQSGDPLENAVAERANGILKTEWLYKMDIKTREECESVLSRIIEFYNNERPHMSVGMQTPAVAHTQYGQQRRCWKNGWVVA